MAGVMTNAGAVYLLDTALNGEVADLTLFLYTNLPSLTVDTVLADLTEASGGGYSSQNISTGSWSVSVVSTVPTAALADYVQFDFTGPLSGDASTYGYGVKSATGVLIGAENYGTQTPTTSGDYISILPTLKMKNGTIS